jgi:hypothetical protein
MAMMLSPFSQNIAWLQSYRHAPRRVCAIRPALWLRSSAAIWNGRHCQPAHLFRRPKSNYTSRQSIVAGGGLIVGYEGCQMQYRSSWMTEELDVFRDQFRKFLAKDLAPHAV